MGPPVVAREEDDGGDRGGGGSHGDPTRVPPSSSSSSPSPSPSSSTPSATERTHLDLRRCSAGDLAAVLVEQRGREEANRILLEATEIVGGAARSSSKREAESGNGTATATANTATDLGQALLAEPAETSLLSPRLGRFKLELYEGGLVATKVGDDAIRLVLSSETVGHVLVFPKPEDCRAIVANGRRDNGDDGGGSSSKKMKTNGSLVLLSLRLPVTTVQNRRTNELCFSLPWDKKVGPTGPRLVTETDGTGSDGEDDPTVAWFRVLQQALCGSSNRMDGRSVSPVFVHVQPGLRSGFQSYQPPGTSTTTGGMPFVSCYHGVNDGALYPLKEGLLFFKPPTFLPRSALHSIACGRGSSGGGGGQSSSRYVDMVVQVRDITTTTGGGDGDGGEKDPKTVEFTNIQREELGPLNEYIRDVLIPSMKEDTERGTVPTSKDGKGQTRPATDGEGGGEGSDTDDEDDAMEAEAVDDREEDDDDEAESDEDDEDFHVDEDDDDDDGEDDDDDDDDDGDHVFGQGHDDEFTVVKDEFAMKLAKEKRKMKESGEESTTESEEEDTSRPRSSKRLRRGG